MQKRGLSGIIYTVLAILLVLSSIVLIWPSIKNLVYKTGTINTAEFDSNFKITANSIDLDIFNKNLSFIISRDAGNSPITGFYYTLKDSIGNSYTNRQNVNLGALHSVRYSIDYSDSKLGKPISMLVTPIFSVNNNEINSSFPFFVDIGSKFKWIDLTLFNITADRSSFFSNRSLHPDSGMIQGGLFWEDIERNPQIIMSYVRQVDGVRIIDIEYNSFNYSTGPWIYGLSNISEFISAVDNQLVYQKSLSPDISISNWNFPLPWGLAHGSESLQASVVNHSDFLVVETYYWGSENDGMESLEEWRALNLAYLNYSINASQGKPIYAGINVLYLDRDGSTPMELEKIKFMYDTVSPYVDGIVLWAYDPYHNWNASLPAFAEAKRRMSIQ